MTRGIAVSAERSASRSGARRDDRIAELHVHQKYRSDIDGLRAIAVMAVLLFHGLPNWVGGGYVGVDVFFVISGYLITGILTDDIDNGRFSIARFYERRIRRILPALVAMVAITGVAATIILLPSDLAVFAGHAAAALLSVSNLSLLGQVGYFQSDADLQPLLHTWSLGVEEQFYLAFPLFLALFRRHSARRLRVALWLAAAGSFALALVLVAKRPDWAFYLSPPRAWELLVGCVLAVSPGLQRARGVLREVLSAAGVALILSSSLFYTATMPFPGAAALAPTARAALMIAAGSGTAVGRLLSTPPLVFVGLISYSLYLWHWPLLAFARYIAIRPLSTFETFAILGFAFLIATASWKWVEQPFRRRTMLKSRARVFGAGGTSVAITALAALGLYAAKGVPERLPRQVATTSAAALDRTSYRDRCLFLAPERFAKDPCRLGNGPTHVLLWGDSHADALSPALDALGRRDKLGIINASHGSCPPTLNVDVISGGTSRNCRRWNNAVLDILDRVNIDTVVLVARWAAYARGRGYGEDQGKLFQLGHDDRASLLHGVEATLRALTGKRVYLVLSVPETRYDVPSALAREEYFHTGPRLEPTLAEHRARQSIVATDLIRLARAHGATVIDPAARLCQSLCMVQDQGRPLYYDNHHLSTWGARELEPLLASAIRPAHSGSAGGRQLLSLSDGTSQRVDRPRWRLFQPARY